jgi:selenoprotein W-related protein
MTKAFWMATELLQKSPETELREVTVIPSEPGNFVISARVRSETEKGGAAVLLWDRKVDGGFPPIDLIEFEQRVRACLEKGPAAATATTDGDAEPQLTPEDLNFGQKSLSHVVIRYCPGILLRAAYYGQELLTTFCEGELDAISLQPMESSSSEFSVGLQAYMQTHQVGFGESPPLVLWDNSDTGKFPEVKELKRLVRDKVTPQKDLGHSEDSKTTTTSKNDTQGEAIEDEVGDCVPCNAAESDTGNEQADEEDEDDDFLDNDEAEEARRYFGVM